MMIEVFVSINLFKEDFCFVLMVLGRLLGFSCKYWNRCKLYVPNAPTCSSRDAQGGHCGEFRKFEEERADKLEKRKSLVSRIMKIVD